MQAIVDVAHINAPHRRVRLRHHPQEADDDRPDQDTEEGGVPSQHHKNQDDGRKAYDARQKAAIDRALAVLEKTPPTGLNDVGAIAVGCALGYLDFRFGHEPWRETHPRLAAWFAEASKLPPLAQTVPVG